MSGTAPRAARSVPELVALVLLVGATIAVVASVSAGLIVLIDGDEFGLGDGGSSRELQTLAEALRLGGTFAGAGGISVLIAVAALWWQVGVLSDEVADLDAESDAVASVDDLGLDAAPYLAAFSALDRIRTLLVWARALFVAAALAAVAVVVSQLVYLTLPDFEFGGPLLASVVLSIGLEATTFSVAVAGWLAVRALLATVAAETTSDTEALAGLDQAVAPPGT